MKVLVTGAAGFIGSTLVMRLLARGDRVVGIDNHNDYYDPALKEARLARFVGHPHYTHLRIDLADRKATYDCFAEFKPEGVVNLAAQAGVRYSIENPLAYIDSNIVGFAHVLEGCRHNGIQHLVYASSSSVYGANTAMPFSVHQNVDHPLSLYAASKKSNELMAHTYSHLYGLPTTGLRFFTVYGPWGRPDMALFKFTKAILAERPSKCSTTASTDAISPISTILSKGSFASWTVRLRKIPTGTATSPIPEPAGLLGGSITSVTTARSSSWTTLTPSKDLWVKKRK